MNKTQRRIKHLKAMHEFIIGLGDENIYMSWIQIVPDEPNENDFEWIATYSNSYEDVCVVFAELVIYDKEHNY